jgi:Tfp pilus assembly protein PilF
MLTSITPIVLCFSLAGLLPQSSAVPAAGSRDQRTEVERLIAEGRRLLDLRQPTEAEGLFLQAAELDGNTAATRMWVLRAQMDQGGRSNDTLDAIEALRAAADGPDFDYLFGMAFARRAEEQLSLRAPQAIAMNFQSAIELLGKATRVDPERYRDAFLPLARAAWYESDLPVARAAVEEAFRRYPQDPEVAFELARIALSQFSEARDDEARVGEAELHWTTARDGFLRAVELSREPKASDPRGQSLLAQAYLQLGHTLMWKDLKDEAQAAYVGALGWNPAIADLTALHRMFGDERLGALLEPAATAFEKRFGKTDARDAALLWWLGYTRYAARRPAEAEAAFRDALAKAPSYANAWFYVALCRYDQKDFAGASDALQRGFALDGAAIIAEARGDRNHVAKVEYLIGPAVEAGRFAEASVLAEICAQAASTEARHWNNLGFFRREEGVRLAELEDREERAQAPAQFEAALSAYERALELAPEDPTYLNDTAVVLHYYLDREHERTLELYAHAARAAEAKLAAGGLDAGTLELVKTALRDATNNRGILERTLAQRAHEAASKTPVEAGSGATGG